MRIKYVVLLQCILLLGTHSVRAVNIEMVTVGNPGNAPDVTGFGRVDYEYQIGKYEVTAGQYTEFLNAVAMSDPLGLYDPNMWRSPYGCKIERLGSAGRYTYQVAADREYRPVNYVSFFDAMRFANWLHNGQGAGDTETGVYNIFDGVSETRSANAKYWIPSEDEWYKAAYHKNDGVTGNFFNYPTSSDRVPSNDLVNPDPGNNANFYQSGHSAIGSPYWMTVVGEFENSVSPYGTFDQGGNVFEWNEAVMSSSSSSFRGLRGGTWTFYSDYLPATFRFGFGPDVDSYGWGFRIAAAAPVPEPTSLLLFSIAALLLWSRRLRTGRS